MVITSRSDSVSSLGVRDKLQDDLSSGLSLLFEIDEVACRSTLAANTTNFSDSSLFSSSLKVEFWMAFIAYETRVSHLIRLRWVTHSNAWCPYLWHLKHSSLLESSSMTIIFSRVPILSFILLVPSQIRLASPILAIRSRWVLLILERPKVYI